MEMCPEPLVPLLLRIPTKNLHPFQTANEVATMKRVRENTRIPIPEVIRYDTSAINILGYEFTLLEHMRGVCAADIYYQLAPDKKKHLLEQLLGFHTMLYEHDWGHCGGLQLNEAGAVVPGKMRNYWTRPHATEVSAPLETDGPHSNFVSLMKAHVAQYLPILQNEPSFAKYLTSAPQLLELDGYLDGRDVLKATKCVLMHRDMHFGNFMCDPETADITGVLNWERSAVLPVPLLNLGFETMLPKPQTQWQTYESKSIISQIKNKGRVRAEAVFAALDLQSQEPYSSLQKIMYNLATLVKVLVSGQTTISQMCIQNLNAAMQKLDVGSPERLKSKKADDA